MDKHITGQEIIDAVAASNGIAGDSVHYQLGSISATLAIILNENPKLIERYKHIVLPVKGESFRSENKHE